MRPSHSNLSVPVLMPVHWTSTTQSVLWGSGNSTGLNDISPGCSKTTAVDVAPMAVLSALFLALILAIKALATAPYRRQSTLVGRPSHSDPLVIIN